MICPETKHIYPVPVSPVYRCICSYRDRLRFYAENKIIFGTVWGGRASKCLLMSTSTAISEIWCKNIGDIDRIISPPNPYRTHLLILAKKKTTSAQPSLKIFSYKQTNLNKYELAIYNTSTLSTVHQILYIHTDTIMKNKFISPHCEFNEQLKPVYAIWYILP